jgi:potassium/chloride transporter 4/5/6
MNEFKLFFQKFIAPTLSIFGDVTIESNAFNAYRIYGTVILLLLSIIVFIGVRFVSKFAAFSLACVILSILCIYIGIFAATEDDNVKYVSGNGTLLKVTGNVSHTLLISNFLC